MQYRVRQIRSQPIRLRRFLELLCPAPEMTDKARTPTLSLVRGSAFTLSHLRLHCVGVSTNRSSRGKSFASAGFLMERCKRHPDRHLRICQASAREQCPASPRNRGARPTLKTAMLSPADRRRAFQLFEDNFLTAVMIQGCDDCNIRGGRQRDILRNPATLLSKRDRASADSTIDQLD